MNLNYEIYESEFLVPINYKGITTDADIRSDLLIENAIVVELKSVETMHPLFTAQLMTYMKLLQKPKGILVNFNSENIMREGHQTFVNEYFRNLKD